MHAGGWPGGVLQCNIGLLDWRSCNRSVTAARYPAPGCHLHQTVGNQDQALRAVLGQTRCADKPATMGVPTSQLVFQALRQSDGPGCNPKDFQWHRQQTVHIHSHQLPTACLPSKMPLQPKGPGHLFPLNSQRCLSLRTHHQKTPDQTRCDTTCLY